MNAAPHDLLLLAEGDDVLIAVRDLEPGAHRASTGSTVVVGEAVALGHKVAVRAIATGERITRCRMPIVAVAEPIATGAWVHTHNLANVGR